MALALIALGVMLLLSPRVAVALSDVIKPAEWTKTMGVCLLTGFALVFLGIAIAALPLLVVILHAGHVPSGVIATDLAPGGLAMQAACVVVGVIASTQLLRAALRARRLREACSRAMHIGRVQRLEHADVLVLPTSEIMAFALEQDRRPVLTTGLIEAVDAADLGRIVDHELVHLKHRHSRFLLLAEFVRSVLPFGLGDKSAEAMRLMVERWADEEATQSDVRSRHSMRRALRSLDGSTVSDMTTKRFIALRNAPIHTTNFGRVNMYLPMIIVAVCTGVAMLHAADHVRLLAVIMWTNH